MRSPRRAPFHSAASTADATTTRSTLRLDRNLGLHGIRDETLLVRGMIHLLDFLRRRLFLAREPKPRSKRYACDRQSTFRVFFHVAGCFINVFIKHKLLFGRDSQKREHLTA